jgi:hypothetical protein
MSCDPRPVPDLAQRVELRLDPQAKLGDVIPLLVRLARRLRDRERTRAATRADQAEAGQPPKPNIRTA